MAWGPLANTSLELTLQSTSVFRNRVRGGAAGRVLCGEREQFGSFSLFAREASATEATLGLSAVPWRRLRLTGGPSACSPILP